MEKSTKYWGYQHKTAIVSDELGKGFIGDSATTLKKSVQYKGKRAY